MNFNNYKNFDYTSSPPLKEQLQHIRIPDMKELDEAMKKDETLRNTLTTPLYKLPSNSLGYNYKYFSNLPQGFSLYHAIQFCLEDFFTQGEFYYSGVEGKIKGFLFYTLKGNTIKGITPYIWNIGIVSFDLHENNTVLLRDTVNLFKGLGKSTDTQVGV